MQRGKAGIPYMFYSYRHYQSLLLIFFSPRKFSLHGTLSFPPLIHSVSLSLPERTSDQGAPLNPPGLPVGQKSPKSSSWRWKHFRSLSAPEVQIQILCLHPGSPEGCVGFSRCEHPIPCDSPLPFPPLPAFTRIIHSLPQPSRVSSCAASHRKPSPASLGRVRGLLSCSYLHARVFHSNIIITFRISFLHRKGRGISVLLWDQLPGQHRTRVGA